MKKNKLGSLLLGFCILFLPGFSYGDGQAEDSYVWGVNIREDRLRVLSGLREEAKKIDEIQDSSAKFEKMKDICDRVRPPEDYSDPVKAADMLDEIAGKISKIPGHARYFLDKVKNMQSKQPKPKVKYYGPERKEYNELRASVIVGVLGSIRTPECVEVLGEFLNDDKDYPVPGPGESISLRNLYANSDYAVIALDHLGIRNPPDRSKYKGLKYRPEEYFKEDRKPEIPFGYNQNPNANSAWRVWWDEVKKGYRNFSFKGGKVEYHRRPDGTWEEFPIQSPPRDHWGIKGDGLLPDPKSPEPPQSNSSLPPAGNGTCKFWQWLVALLVILFAGGFYWRGKSRRTV